MPYLMTNPGSTPSPSTGELGQSLTVNHRHDASYFTDGLACYAPLDIQAKAFLNELSQSEVKKLNIANIDRHGNHIFGVMDVVGAASAGTFAGAHAMGSRYVQRVGQIQGILDEYRTGDRITRQRLKPRVEAHMADISRQFSTQIERAASLRSRRPHRNPYLSPERAMNIAADSRRGIDLKDNNDIQRTRSFLRNTRFISGVGTIVAVGLTGQEAYTNYKNGAPWAEDAAIGVAAIGGASGGAAVVTVLAAGGPVGWVILGAGAAGAAGAFLASAGTKRLIDWLNE